MIQLQNQSKVTKYQGQPIQSKYRVHWCS